MQQLLPILEQQDLDWEHIYRLLAEKHADTKAQSYAYARAQQLRSSAPTAAAATTADGVAVHLAPVQEGGTDDCGPCAAGEDSAGAARLCQLTPFAPPSALTWTVQRGSCAAFVMTACSQMRLHSAAATLMCTTLCLPTKHCCCRCGRSARPALDHGASAAVRSSARGQRLQSCRTSTPRRSSWCSLARSPRSSSSAPRTRSSTPK